MASMRRWPASPRFSQATNPRIAQAQFLRSTADTLLPEQERVIEVDRPICLAERRSEAIANYFGDRESACVFTSRLCLSTTRRNSRSIVLNASWITLLMG